MGWGLKNLGTRVPSTGCRAPGAEHRVPSTGCRAPRAAPRGAAADGHERRSSPPAACAAQAKTIPTAPTSPVGGPRAPTRGGPPPAPPHDAGMVS
jgi:hypothetical protein